jgi:hypothetical protein
MRPPRVGRAQDVNVEFSDFHAYASTITSKPP